MTGLRFVFALVAVPLWIGIQGCASYSHEIYRPRSMYEAGNHSGALSALKPLAEKKDVNELLYLMDMGLIHHAAGQYNEAISVFMKADKLAEIEDYTSLTTEAATILLSDDVKSYKGEDFEKVLIHVYLAMDFALSGKYESALVESRRVNHILDLMISQGQLPYERNKFAKYLTAALFEAQGEWNSAFVDYRQLLKWDAAAPLLGVPLIRMADRLGAQQEFQEFKKRYSEVQDFRLGKGKGDVVLLLENGKAPEKVPNPAFRLLPMFRRRPYSSDYVWLRESSGKMKGRSFVFYDVEGTAIRELEHRTGLIMAKKIAGVVVKEVVADQVAKATKSKFAGALTSLFLHATDRADTRSWTTLPAQFQIARGTLPVGKYRLVLDSVSRFGNVSHEVRVFDDVEIKPGQTTFLHTRILD